MEVLVLLAYLITEAQQTITMRPHVITWELGICFLKHQLWHLQLYVCRQWKTQVLILN